MESMHARALLLIAVDAAVVASFHCCAITGGSMSLTRPATSRSWWRSRAEIDPADRRVGTAKICLAYGICRSSGLRNALRFALHADSFDAAEALRLGLVHRVVPAAELQRETMVLAQSVPRKRPTLAHGHVKRPMQRSFDTDLPTRLDAESDQSHACTRTADFPERMVALSGQRIARFDGA